MQSSINLLKTCRSCLRTYPTLRNLFDGYTENGLKLSRCYEICANLEINEDDELPKMICVMCEVNLIAAFYFRRQCVEAVNLFFKNCKAEVKKATPPTSPSPHKCPFIIKQEVKEQREIETETNPSVNFETESQETVDSSINNMAVDAIDQQECFPDPYRETPDGVLLGDSSPEALQQNLPHILKESRYFQCPKCQKAFISDRHLEIHLKSHKKDLYECEICNRKCPSKSVLKVHLKKHRAPLVNEEIKKEAMKDVFVVEYLYGFRPE